MNRSDSSSSSSDSDVPSPSPDNPPTASAPEVRATGPAATVTSIVQSPLRGRHKLQRPKFLQRKSSGPIIVPRNYVGSPGVKVYAPDDARGMSPRRNSRETEEIEQATRLAVQEHARQVQLNLLEIAESIELVKADYEKLEKQNTALQDYIGGLTRSMSRSAGGSSKAKGK